MPETKLSKDIQVFIIQQLAVYEKPAFVRDALKQNFDVEISLQAVLNYQPTSPKFNENGAICSTQREKVLLKKSVKSRSLTKLIV
jgi:hypothetical protein